MSFIPALIIRQDHTDNINPNSTIGLTGLIPTPNSGGQVDSDYWCVPVTGFGIFGGVKFVAINSPGGTPKPSAQSFAAVRIVKKDQSTDWYVVGNSSQYIAASEEVECCGTTSPPPIMPTTAPIIAPCQILCNQNSTTGLYFGNVGIPTIPAGERLYAFGFFNEVALTSLSGAGYASVAALLAAIQAAWGIVGTWTVTSDNLTLVVTQSAGPGTDVLCVNIHAA